MEPEAQQELRVQNLDSCKGMPIYIKNVIVGILNKHLRENNQYVRLYETVAKNIQ